MGGVELGKGDVTAVHHLEFINILAMLTIVFLHEYIPWQSWWSRSAACFSVELKLGAPVIMTAVSTVQRNSEMLFNPYLTSCKDEMRILNNLTENKNTAAEIS